MPEPSSANRLEDGCLRCLFYFGIFKYPLTEEEIYRFNPYPATLTEIRQALHKLAEAGKIFHIQSFYLLKEEKSWIEDRLAGNEKALKLLSRSKKFSSVIAAFPFVRGIAISGSLSKFYASKNADVDFFIICDSDRLWIARTLLHLFKKLTFISGHQHYFCMNYFIDTRALRITHPNEYSAIETVTLLPAFNAGLIRMFEQENSWTRDYLPNHPGILNHDYLIRERKYVLKSLFEGLINIISPEKLNAFLMRLTDRKWRRKWKRADYPPEDYDLAFMTDLHISRNHPANYEKKVLQALSENQLANEPA